MNEISASWYYSLWLISQIFIKKSSWKIKKSSVSKNPEVMPQFSDKKNKCQIRIQISWTWEFFNFSFNLSA